MKRAVIFLVILAVQMQGYCALQFNAQADENIRNDEVVVSGGIADYRPQEDNSFDRVFIRADEEMYKRKEELKKIGVYKR